MPRKTTGNVQSTKKNCLARLRLAYDTTRHVPNGGNLVEPAECESRINVRNLHGNLKVP